MHAGVADIDGVSVIRGALPGPTLAVFGGVHGNERAGVDLVRGFAGLAIDAGTLYLVEANPPAIAANVRQLSKNLNRAFLADTTGTEPEDIRARELMRLLDTCDALLDIHASNSRDAVPFIITEAEGFPLARRMRVPIVSTGWDALEPGATDGYMHRKGKVGVCLEAGSVFDSDSQRALVHEAALQFLLHFGLLPGVSLDYSATQRHIAVHTVHHRVSDDFVLAKEFADFEPLVPGKVFARDGTVEFRATEGDCIIFARPNAAQGSEAFILGRDAK